MPLLFLILLFIAILQLLIVSTQCSKFANQLLMFASQLFFLYLILSHSHPVVNLFFFFYFGCYCCVNFSVGCYGYFLACLLQVFYLFLNVITGKCVFDTLFSPLLVHNSRIIFWSLLHKWHNISRNL